MKEPLSRFQILSPISVGRLIELTPRHAYNDIWTRSQWHDAAIPHRSERMGGQHSSTRTELETVVMALRGLPRADDQPSSLTALLPYKDYDHFVVTTSNRPSTRSRTTTSSMSFCLNSSGDPNHPHELFL